MIGMRHWFDGRSLREKRLLLVMGALLILTILWAAVIRPVGDGLSSARERHASAVTRLGETQARVAALREARASRSAALTGTLADVVRLQADAASFALATLDQDGPDRVRVTIQSARPAALVAWLARLERAGILVDAASLSNAGSDTVGVTLTLKARAS